MVWSLSQGSWCSLTPGWGCAFGFREVKIRGGQELGLVAYATRVLLLLAFCKHANFARALCPRCNIKLPCVSNDVFNIRERKRSKIKHKIYIKLNILVNKIAINGQQCVLNKKKTARVQKQNKKRTTSVKHCIANQKSKKSRQFFEQVCFDQRYLDENC